MTAALVTGAAQRIGRAIALDLARRGRDVAVHYAGSAEAAESVVAEIASTGRSAVAIAADLSDAVEVRALIGRAADALGPIEALVNNASIFERDEALTASEELWDRHIAVNARAPLILSQELARRLSAGREGCVINLIDQRVWNLTPHFISYTVSKAALWTLTQTLAMALAPRVRVNAVAPGPTLPSLRQSAEHFARQAADTPLGRPAAVGDICEAVGFLLEASSVTGQMIAIDSGQHLGWRRSDAERVFVE